MNPNLSVWKTGRESIARLVGRYSAAQLNHIPQGFSNNVAWNLGHLIVVQQSLVYRLSGLEMKIPAPLYEMYKPGSRPGDALPGEELEALRALLLSTVETTLADYEAGVFSSFKPLTTSRGFHLESLEDALAFNNFHEGLHTGTIMDLAKFL